MDLVDIDKVLDNLELNEEEHKEEIPIMKQRQTQILPVLPLNVSDHSINYGYGASANLNLNSTGTCDRVNRFVGVSQVFSSLDDYRKNVESLETGLDLYKNSNSNNKTSDNNDTYDNNTNTTNYNSNNTETEQHRSGLLIRDDEEANDVEADEEDPYAGGDEINKYVCTDEYGFSSNSITTSSSSTFSSGPSPALLSTESESSLNNFNAKEIAQSNLAKENDHDDLKITSNNMVEASAGDVDGEREVEATSHTNVSSISNQDQHAQQQHRSEFDDLAVGLSSISLTTTRQGSILSSSEIVSSKYNLKTDLDTLGSLSLSLPQTTKNNYQHSEEPKDFVEPNNGRYHHEQHNESMVNLENSGSDILKAEQPNSQQNNVMVTFSSTMDEISDTELDSILQEIDAEMPSHNSPPAETGVYVNSLATVAVAAAVSEKDAACSTEIRNNKVTKMDRNSGHSNQETKLLTSSISPNNLSLGQKCDDGMNIDSFSQASTLEFTEDRPRPEVDDHHHTDSTSSKGLDGDGNDDNNDDDDDDEICDVVDSKEKKDNLQSDIQKRQRPTTLDLPARKINLYATAGQTPPGSRIYDQSTSSSEEDTPEEKLGATAKNNEDHVNFNNNDGAGHTPPERSDRGIFGATLSVAAAPAPATDAETGSFDEPMTAAPSLESTQGEIKVPESVVVSPSEVDNMMSTDGTAHNIGKVPPIWVPDQEANACMQCQHKFTLLKRRHHCRACGQVLCSVCCSQKFKLEFLSNLESRVCVQCFLVLTKLQQQMDQQMGSSTTAMTAASASTSSSPNPNNPMEYCSKIPPHRQVNPQAMSSYPTVIVPVGVLKKEGNPTKSRKRKSVMFSDGIRPGSDLASLDQKWSDAKHARKSISSTNNLTSDNLECTTNTESQNTKITRSNSNKSILLMDDGNGCFIPPTGENTLPPIMIMKKSEKVFQELANNADLVKRLQSESLKFVLQTNFFVFVKISHLKCCINKTVINFTTCGLNNVGNDEIIILLELDNSNKIPKDIFVHLNEIYWEASRGHPITELGFSMPKHLHFLGSREHGGFLFIRSSFQCLLDVHVPTSPFLIGVLIHRWEVPWAKIFPLRLMLRLGAQYRYYPSPHISVREREPVYAEIAQTIINLLADFRNYTYTIPTIKGMYIHMEDRRTNILIPRNRLDEVIKAINNSSDHILAMGANFSKKADGHLVCIQNIKSDSGDSHAYSTQAINIQGQPRKVTGASFFVLNEALKTTSGLSGKCSIIEDGLMVQILPSKMAEIRTALINMKDINIVCGPIEADEHQTEVVYIQWVDDDVEINIGVRSPIDLKRMDGIPSIRVHSGVTLSNNNHILKWTEVFIIEVSGDNGTCKAAFDISKVSEQIAKNASVALLPFLDLLVANGNVKIGLRVTLNNDNVCYEAGSQNEKLPPLYMNALDNELIPTLHKQTNDIGKSIVLELIFHILNVHINV